MLNTASSFPTDEYKDSDVVAEINSIHEIEVFTKRYGQIPAKSFFKINEVLELLDIRPYVLRFWETEFDKISPTKSQSGQLIYSFLDVACLLMIKTFLLEEKLPVENARLKLDQEFNSVIGPIEKKYRRNRDSISNPSEENFSDPTHEGLQHNQQELTKLLVISSDSDFIFHDDKQMDNEADNEVHNEVEVSKDSNPVFNEGFAQDSLFSTMAMETFTNEDESEDNNEVEVEVEVDKLEPQPVASFQAEEDKFPRMKADSLALIHSNLQSMRRELNQLRENLSALIR
ncbi:MAG: MerR family transcriptional regulator [Bacteriovoracaceae bacterium]|nr:MerR family transcriptional regulator [Bacteriovoracaceae bacterium]